MNRHSKIDNTKVLSPKLRFPLFKEFWNYKRFEELYKLETTNSLSRANLNYQDGKVFNIHYGDIHTKFPSHIFIDKIKIPLINPEIDLTKIKEECYCKEGDLVIADASEDYGDLGKSIEIINLGNKKLLAGLHTYLARPITGLVTLGFMSYLMMSWKVRKQIMVLSNGTKVYGLPRKSLLETLLIIPSSEEQKKIASFLSSVDSKIEKLTRKKELLEEYKKGVMQKLFSQEIRFKDDDENDYPDWEEKKLEDTIRRISIRNFQIKSSEIESFGELRVVDQGKKLVSGFSNQKNKLFLNDGAIVYGDHTTNIKYIDFDFIIGADGVIVMKSLKNYLKYLYYNISFNNIQPEGYKRHYSILKDVFLQIPFIDEQKKIASFLSAIDSKIESVSSQIDKTKEFKKGLLQQMFV